MTTEQYDGLKKDYIKHIKEYINQTGGLFPHFSVFADVKNPSPDEEGKPAIIHIPIPDKFIQSEQGKDEFIEDVVPELFQSIKEKFLPVGLAWASEAWMRTADKENFDIKDYKKLPKKEVIIINIESKEENESIIYEVERVGMKINKEGELSDSVNLTEITNEKDIEMGGRFTGLFKLF